MKSLNLFEQTLSMDLEDKAKKAAEREAAKKAEYDNAVKVLADDIIKMLNAGDYVSGDYDGATFIYLDAHHFDNVEEHIDHWDEYVTRIYGITNDAWYKCQKGSDAICAILNAELEAFKVEDVERIHATKEDAKVKGVTELNYYIGLKIVQKTTSISDEEYNN